MKLRHLRQNQQKKKELEIELLRVQEMRENLNAENEKLKEEAAIQKEFELELQQIKAAKQNLMDEMASLKEESEKKN